MIWNIAECADTTYVGIGPDSRAARDLGKPLGAAENLSVELRVCAARANVAPNIAKSAPEARLNLADTEYLTL